MLESQQKQFGLWKACMFNFGKFIRRLGGAKFVYGTTIAHARDVSLEYYRLNSLRIDQHV